ncbi:MAG: 3-oxoacyl-[acyl-carrier protein] reductase [Acidimicrobiaceae bacterium]|nr:3-oxoacyl-[acyl-carrier protein] reductase [Acidimicrobiaceae bacterium]
MITGVSRRIGIGYAVASRLARDGADVLAHSWTDHDAEMPWGADPLGIEGVIQALRDEVGDGAGRISHMEADFEHPLSPRAVIEQAVADFGHVDIVVANHARSSHEAFGDLTAGELDTCLRINVTATMLLVQAFAHLHDDARPGGRVVLFSSGQHLVPMPDEIPYIAGKGALLELTRTVASALVRRGIMVNCINPGGTDTGYASAERLADEAARHPQGRWGEPDDAARLIAWLVSDEARWVTGQVINSDGGWYL